jgi:hypothetical protein
MKKSYIAIAAIALVCLIVALVLWLRRKRSSHVNSFSSGGCVCKVVALVNGLQGSGKSSLAKFVSEMAPLNVVDLDIFTQVTGSLRLWWTLGLDIDVMVNMRSKYVSLPAHLTHQQAVKQLIVDYVNESDKPVVFVGIDDYNDGFGSVLSERYTHIGCMKRYLIDLGVDKAYKRLSKRYSQNSPSVLFEGGEVLASQDFKNMFGDDMESLHAFYENSSFDFKVDDPYELAKRIVTDLGYDFDEESGAAKEFKAGVDGMRSEGLLFMFDQIKRVS